MTRPVLVGSESVVKKSNDRNGNVSSSFLNDLVSRKEERLFLALIAGKEYVVSLSFTKQTEFSSCSQNSDNRFLQFHIKLNEKKYLQQRTRKSAIVLKVIMLCTIAGDIEVI